MSELLSTKELADYLKVPAQTLAYWRMRGKGPKFIVIGEKLVRYREDDVRLWLDRGEGR